MFLVSPTYEGACADIASATKACHAAGVPLIVDEAHGAHLAFLGAEDESRGDSPRGEKRFPSFILMCFSGTEDRLQGRFCKGLEKFPSFIRA